MVFGMKKSFICILAVLLCISLLGGCGCAPTDEARDYPVLQEGGKGVVSLPLTHFDTFNPVLTQSDTVLDAMQLVYDSLYRRAADGTVQPLLATATEISPDGLVYTVYLRNDVRWHDGELFSAYDVSYTLDAIAACETSKLRGCLQGIASYTAKSNFVCEFVLSAPDSCFTDRLTFPVIPRSTDCSAIYEDFMPIGTSAYRYVETSKSRTHLLCRSKDCTSVVAGPVEEVVLKEIPAADNLMYALESREIEAVHVDAAYLRTYSAKGNVRTMPYTNRNFSFLGINAIDVLADKNVRKALSMVIDRETINTNVLFGRFTVSDSPFLWEKSAEETPEATPVEAAQLLETAGYAQNEDGKWKRETEEGIMTLSVSILVNLENKVRCAVAEEIAKQLRAFGIGAYVDKTDFETYTMRVDAREYNLFLGETVLETDMDVSVFVGSWARFASPVGQNMDRLLYNARVAVTPESKATAFRALADGIADEMPVISLGFGQNAVVVNDRIRGEITPVYQNIFCDFATWDAA